MSQGAAIWWERMQERQRRAAAAATACSGASDPPQVEPVRPWTTARVVRALESVLCRAAHGARRARWLCRLRYAALCWETAERSRWRVLVLFDGQVVARAWSEPHQAVSHSVQACGHGERSSPSFDLATFDRLRVLTTELRRLRGAGRQLALWTNTDGRPRLVAVDRALSWV
ncbi:MAG: hypothetical protein JRI23_12135 [Deltaproteobacteria bacterium]|jgi:hypothetical protein|nr:hypothetical protein [Deltaproteobacteria bacterium]MBW2532458.1 hypothetical protein [Deltaproteobacteria bacterium]